MILKLLGGMTELILREGKKKPSQSGQNSETAFFLLCPEKPTLFPGHGKKKQVIGPPVFLSFFIRAAPF